MLCVACDHSYSKLNDWTTQQTSLKSLKPEIIKILANPGLVYSGLEELSPLS